MISGFMFMFKGESFSHVNICFSAEGSLLRQLLKMKEFIYVNDFFKKKRVSQEAGLCRITCMFLLFRI